MEYRERTTQIIQTFTRMATPFGDFYNGNIPIHANGAGSLQLGRLAIKGEGGMVNYVLEETTDKGDRTRATIDSKGNVRYKSDPSKNLRNVLEHQIGEVDLGAEMTSAVMEYLSDEIRVVSDSPEARADIVGPYLSSSGVASAHVDERGVLNN